MTLVADYLNEVWSGDPPFEWCDVPNLFLPDGEPLRRVHVLAALIDMNGGIGVREWGCIDGFGNEELTYGRHGLYQNEALALIGVGAYVQGLADGIGQGAREELVAIINAERDRVRAARGSR